MNKRAIVADSRRPAKAAHIDAQSAEARRIRSWAREFVIGAAQAAQLPAPGVPEIAFAGRSNAGKSSAINALASRTRLAFASRTPGRTQQINLFALRVGRARRRPARLRLRGRRARASSATGRTSSGTT